MLKHTVGAVLLACLQVTAALAAAPQLRAERTEYNFGEVFQGEKVEQVFKFRNEGDADLIIDRVRTSCGCTAALLSSTSIPPGESGELRTAFDSARFSGPVVKTVYLYSNDPLLGVVQFVLKGTVKQELLATPPLADLGIIPTGGTKEVRIELSNLGTAGFPLLGVDTLAPDLSAHLSAEQLLPNQPVILRLRATPKEGRTRLNGYVIVKTGSARTPELRIPVYGSVASPGTGR